MQKIYNFFWNFQVSFTIRPENPGRIGFLVTMMLALVNIFMSVRTSSPTSSSDTVSSIGSWLVYCLIFVILCLVEYGIILYKKYLSYASGTSEPVKQVLHQISKAECRKWGIKGKFLLFKRAENFGASRRKISFRHSCLSSKHYSEDEFKKVDRIALFTAPFIFVGFIIIQLPY